MQARGRGGDLKKEEEFGVDILGCSCGGYFALKYSISFLKNGNRIVDHLLSFVNSNLSNVLALRRQSAGKMKSEDVWCLLQVQKTFTST